MFLVSRFARTEPALSARPVQSPRAEVAPGLDTDTHAVEPRAIRTQHTYSLQTAAEMPYRSARDYADMRASLYEFEGKNSRSSANRRAECRVVAQLLRAELHGESRFDAADYFGTTLTGPLKDVHNPQTFSVHLLETTVLRMMRLDPAARKALENAQNEQDVLRAFNVARGPARRMETVKSLVAHHERNTKLYLERSQTASFVAGIAAGALSFGPAGALAGVAAYRVTRTPGWFIAQIAPYTGYLGHPKIDLKAPT